MSKQRGRPPVTNAKVSLRAWITEEQWAWLKKLAATNPDRSNISWAVRQALEMAMGIVTDARREAQQERSNNDG